jgi:deoxyribose-phosphate aldolase
VPEVRRAELAKTLEPMLLRPNASASEIQDLCDLAEREHVAAVVVFPVWVPFVRARLDRTDVRVCAAIAYPYGGESEPAKSAGAAQAVRDGAHDIEVVASLPALANGDFQAVRDELAAVARAARSVRAGTLVRGVLESCYLEDRALRLAARVIASAELDGATTSTGVGPEGATVKVVRVLREELPGGSLIKAAGGIGSAVDARQMLDAGATRLGTTAAGRVLDDLRAER